MPPSSDDNVESPHDFPIYLISTSENLICFVFIGFQGPEPRGSQATQILSMLLFGGFVKKFLKSNAFFTTGKGLRLLQQNLKHSDTSELELSP
ncbi:hypothetical protein CsSME_00007416 [Camellia sinensis var. sinensis]